MSILITNKSGSSTTPALNVVSKTTTYMATITDGLILCSGSSFSVTLPAATNSGTVIRIQKTDADTTNVITIATAGSDVIDGATSTTLNTQYEVITLIADGGTGWYILDRNYPTNWVAYTPIFTGFGTVTDVSFFSRRIGDSLQVQGKWTNGATSSTQARISLGYGGVEGNVAIDTVKIPAVRVGGILTQNQNLSGGIYVNIPSGTGPYVQFGYSDALNGPEGAGVNGNTLFTGGAVQSLIVEVPIAGWN